MTRIFNRVGSRGNTGRITDSRGSAIAKRPARGSGSVEMFRPVTRGVAIWGSEDPRVVNSGLHL